MRPTPSRPGQQRGILLLDGTPEAAAAWGRRGTVPLHVVPLEGWTALVLAGPARTAAPYDQGLPILAGRPVSGRLRAALGFFVIGGRAVVTVQPRGWRSVTRWAVWEPAAGLVRSPGLPLARPHDLAGAARLEDVRCEAEVRELLRCPAPEPVEMLAGLMQVLELPGEALLRGGATPTGTDGATVVEPDDRAVERFDATVRDDVRFRAELEERP